MSKTSRQWGVFCQGVLDAGVKIPRYRTNDYNEARRLKRQADRECQVKAAHYVRKVEMLGDE